MQVSSYVSHVDNYLKVRIFNISKYVYETSGAMWTLEELQFFALLCWLHLSTQEVTAWNKLSWAAILMALTVRACSVCAAL